MLFWLKIKWNGNRRDVIVPTRGVVDDVRDELVAAFKVVDAPLVAGESLRGGEGLVTGRDIDAKLRQIRTFHETWKTA